jgi:hypothetical protein
MLKLDHLVLLRSITFGKYEQPHVCNVKNVQVFCGVDEEHMTLVLEECLTNDSTPESFPISHTVSGHVVPTKFVKIAPLRTYGSNSFNFSIWYVKLEGCDDTTIVGTAYDWLQEHRKKEAVRLCMKHLRQCNYTEAYEELRKKARVELEHPKLTELYNRVVVRGDYEVCERVMSEAAEEGLLDDYVSKQPIEVKWRRMAPRMTADEGHPEAINCPGMEGSSSYHGNSDSWPGMRGGHAMCVDPMNEVVYLFGGYNGSRELGDFWKFEQQRSRWILLSSDTSAQGGPSSRSCHKMVLDSKHQKLYCLGYYGDPQSRIPLFTDSTSRGDFFSFDIRNNSWSKISANTLICGGPPPIFDHQMCIDEDRKLIFVFGGKTNAKNLLSPGYHSDESVSKGSFSGLYVYNISTDEWKQLRKDGSSAAPGEIVGRMAHTMVYHSDRQELYIMGGQRNKEQLHDMLIYQVPSDTLIVQEDQRSTLGLMCGFALRAVIDPIKDQIHIYTGLDNRREASNPDQLQTSLWIYDIVTAKLSCVYRHEMMGSSFWLISQSKNKLPCPRFGHQFVYDHVHQIHYLFGGNPGNNKQPSMRLDDFWLLKLARMSREQVLRKSIFMIRQHQYEELMREDPVEAIRFLQNNISSIVNHDNWDEEQQFRALSSTLFNKGDTSDLHGRRSKLYDSLSGYFPDTMSQPSTDLCDLITY